MSKYQYENERGSTKQPPPFTSDSLVGRKWLAVINGKKSVNGERHSVTHSGNIAEADNDKNLYDVLRELACHLEEENTEMEYPDSMQVTIFPPNVQGHASTPKETTL